MGKQNFINNFSFLSGMSAGIAANQLSDFDSEYTRLLVTAVTSVTMLFLVANFLHCVFGYPAKEEMSGDSSLRLAFKKNS